ncbi:hypothetical protein A6A04_10575 [Paramagnetospirillum marisnigri]|uniref:Class I SAM-dependent methyltransferase n=1 Tax=Paramagnetospirillum marisnigri TaxID=1285242 RepID=A0A178MXG1_9PROT|nr:class I SAM-dependent methyltransferase [Paramagnetospirillum marisnigri]OAN55996.1 hypothetical protein A6A04_10575 [Paramagnetospirillum marisnigri]
MAAQTILFFPAGMMEVAGEAVAAQRRGEQVIGASSLDHDPDRVKFRDWEWLPFVFAPEFDAQFAALVARRHVTRVVSFHGAVWAHLARLLPSLPNPPELHPPRSPISAREGGQGRVWREDAEYLAEAWLGLAVPSLPSGLEFDGLADTAARIQGESNALKLAALVAVASVAPLGDVVEIGTLYGRSAFVLGWLARRYSLGPVLCVDPWRAEAARQAPAFLAELSQGWDMDPIFEGFRRNLSPCFHGTLNYQRQTSRQVRGDYGPGWQVTTPEFGATSYTGRISILHIDGNHDFDCVQSDVADWLPLVSPGGWLVLDDYFWPFGDGPRRVGDRLLAEGGFDFAAVIAKALFLRRSACE